MDTPEQEPAIVTTTALVIPPTKLGARPKPIVDAAEPNLALLPKPNKLYYTIGEVALLLQVKSSSIRFWESEFPHLRPKTNKKGDRRYKQNDIQAIKVIHSLIKDKGFTLQGARDFLDSQQQHSKPDILAKLKEIKRFMQDLKALLDQAKQG